MPAKVLFQCGGNVRHQGASRKVTLTTATALGGTTITATAGGGAVSVTANGRRQLTKIEIKKEVVDPDDVEMLQDLILVAANESLRQIEEISSAEMGKLTGGLGIPGL